MATEYFQIPSSQGSLSLDASLASLSNSGLLSSSGAFAQQQSNLSASTVPTASDPWLTSTNNAFKTMSLDDWGLKKSNNTPPSLFEPDDIEARSWENIVPQQTPEVLKASFELKNSYEMKNSSQMKTSGRFALSSSKLDAWSALDPTVTISSPSLKGSSSSALKRSTTSMQDDDENSLNRYKTELCKSFTETGVCRYGVKCQFAHGKEELRPVLRHPKYKTEICKTFHNTGTCPYGIRCRFIHTRTKEEHHVFASSTSSFIDSDFENEDSENDETAKMTPPPGIPVPQWSKSWTPTASPVIRGSKSGLHLSKSKLQA